MSAILEALLICACIFSIGMLISVWLWKLTNNDDEHYFDDEV